MHRNRTPLYLTLILALFILGYGIFEARALITGPTLTIHHPAPGETVTDVLLAIRGEAQQATQISVNGRIITPNQNGAFNETLLTPNGYGVVVVEAEDRFGRTTHERIEIVGKPTREDDTLSFMNT